MSKRFWLITLGWIYTLVLCLLYPFGYAFNALVKHMKRLDSGIWFDWFYIFLLCLLYPFGYAFNELVKHMKRRDKEIGA